MDMLKQRIRTVMTHQEEGVNVYVDKPYSHCTLERVLGLLRLWEDFEIRSMWRPLLCSFKTIL